ncbi:ABC transporter ATP-binding protein [Marinilactibacillus psychrotolerans]|uniref:ABC transporter ATP-binding protein n=1 Tax=Marinilactibacillus psychrotolerans TaxID=191770 RepID=UPI001F3ACA00|nr:ABC transporter ATP-binding protein [Marinilactibacillus psychrotolerans]
MKDVSLQVKNNQITSLIGSNGAGKSTLIGVMVGYYRIDSGKVMKSNISVMPDANSLFEDFTGEEFLNFMSKLKKISNTRALELADALMLKEDLKKKISGYSFGMKKKISFIQACIGNYDTYILDEPTSGVDEPSAIMMLEIVEQLKESGSAILLTSHNLDELERVSDFVYIIENGEIVSKGSVADIISRKSSQNNLLYVLKSLKASEIYRTITEYFNIEIKIQSKTELELEIKNEKELREVLSYIFEKEYLITEIYQKKKSLRETVYKK